MFHKLGTLDESTMDELHGVNNWADISFVTYVEQDKHVNYAYIYA